MSNQAIIANSNMSNFNISDESNLVKIGSKVVITGFIKGKNNIVNIDDPVHDCIIDIRLNGSGNTVNMGKAFSIKKT